MCGIWLQVCNMEKWTFDREIDANFLPTSLEAL